MTKARIGIVFAGATLALLGLGGCNWSSHTDATEPSGPNIKDATDIRVTKFSDGFRNVESGCDTRGNLLYVTSAGADDTRPSAVTVIPGGCSK